MRGAFTLIEVLAAVAIASIAGIALLKMNSSHLFLLGKLQNYSVINEVLAVGAMHNAVTYNRSDKTLYDLLEADYTIGNDDLRQYLKSQKYTYTETVADTITFDAGMFSSDMNASEEMEKSDNAAVEEAAAAAPLIQFELVKITLKDGTRHGSILQIRSMTE